MDFIVFVFSLIVYLISTILIAIIGIFGFMYGLLTTGLKIGYYSWVLYYSHQQETKQPQSQSQPQNTVSQPKNLDDVLVNAKYVFSNTEYTAEEVADYIRVSIESYNK